MKYDVSKLKPLIEKPDCKVYTLGHVTEDKTKGVVIYNNTGDQYEAIVNIKHKYVVSLLQKVR